MIYKYIAYILILMFNINIKSDQIININNKIMHVEVHIYVHIHNIGIK